MIEKIMNLLAIQPSGNLDAVVRQVAEESLDDVSQLVAGRTNGMNFSEARGYLRARASKIVRRRTRIVLAKSPEFKPSELAKIAQLATERLVPLVIRQARVGVPELPTIRRAA